MINRRTILSLGSLAPIGIAGLGCSTESGSNVTVTSADVVRWIEAYGRAWETKDADAAAQLFTEDAEYAVIPGVTDQTYFGRSAIHSYWGSITAGQSNVIVRHGAPIVQGARAMVELWVTMQVPVLNPNGDHFVTLLEVNVLYFASRELVVRNHEYWNISMGFIEPPVDWGEEALP